MNFFKLYIGDYQRDTGHLSVTEHGAYLLMLQHYYATERPLPVGKALHRLLRATDKVERDAIDSVTAQFWHETEAGLVNDRADEEIRKGDHQRTVNREVGKLGGNPYLKQQYNEPGELYAARLPDGRIKVGITGAGWSKRAYGLAKTYGEKPELLIKTHVKNMGLAEEQVLSEFSKFASGEVLTLPAELEPNLLASIGSKGVPIHQPNRQAITSPNQTPDTRDKDSLRSSKARDKRTPDDVQVPDWVPVVSWRAFVQHRKDIRKPLTAHAADLAIAELGKLKAQGHEPAAVINQSIVSRWAGLFPLKGASHVNASGTGNAGRSLSAPERVAAAIAERDATAGRTLEHPHVG